MLKLFGLAALSAMIAIGAAGAASAQTNPGPIVTPQTLPQTGQMQSDAVKRETEDAVKRANQSAADKNDASKTMAPAGK